MDTQHLLIGWGGRCDDMRIMSSPMSSEGIGAKMAVAKVTAEGL